jgi:hypothetical protein
MHWFEALGLVGFTASITGFFVLLIVNYRVDRIEKKLGIGRGDQDKSSGSGKQAG